MRTLEEEKARCSTAMADIARIVDFVEKVGAFTMRKCISCNALLRVCEGEPAPWSQLPPFLTFFGSKCPEFGLRHGTDVEVLLAKSHLSREQVITQKVQAVCFLRA